MKKRLKKENVFFVLLTVALIVTVAAAAVCYSWIQHDNEKLHSVTLAEGSRDGEFHVLPDFTLTLMPRGGDSASWNKDPILDEAGNEIYVQSLGTIYELTMKNTSDAKITDWVMELYMPEFLWINNAWNGTLEFHQTSTGEELVQELDLREYNSKAITLDYYIDHTGPMIPMNQGDWFVYHPSKADNEMPLDPVVEGEETNSTAIVGFIVYIPGKQMGYVTNFDNAKFSYYLQRNPLSSPYFIVLVVLACVWITLLIAMAIAHFRIRKLLKQQEHDAKIIEQSINTFINFIEAKDPNTKGHSERVAKIAYALASDMGYSPRECNRIYYIALMHDCGKISIPVDILRKPGKLTDEEYEEIKNHTVYGEKMLRDFTSIDGINLGVLYHHERYDGTGYPKGLKGEEIPVIARIICVADALDAMNSNRYYRPKLTKEEILKDLEYNRGKQFDPDVIDHLMKLIKHNVIIIGE